MKRLAICVSGSLRSLEYCKDNFVKNIIIPNKENYEIIVFYYLPNDINSKKIDLLKGFNKQIQIEDDIELKIPDCVWQGRPSSFFADNVSSGGLVGYMQQLYGIEKCYEMVKKYEKKNNMRFDVMLRTRSDVKYKNELKISNYDLNQIILPKFHYWDGINDRFALGTRDIMETYMQMYSNIYKITEKYKTLYNKKIHITKAEYFCKMNLDLVGIKYDMKKEILFKRVRMNGLELNDY